MDISPVVLAVSETNMINLASRFCDSSTQQYPLQQNYIPVTCCLEDRRFMVIGHQEGHSHSAPFYKALAHQGAKIIVKAGTCHTLKPRIIPVGSVVVPSRVVCDPQGNRLCAEEYFPVFPTPRVYTTVLEAGREENCTLLTGDSLSTAAYVPNSLHLEYHLDRWADKAETAEPDLYNLFYTSASRDVQSAGMLAVTNNPYGSTQKAVSQRIRGCVKAVHFTTVPLSSRTHASAQISADL